MSEFVVILSGLIVVVGFALWAVTSAMFNRDPLDYQIKYIKSVTNKTKTMNTKKWYQSKTIWGLLIATIGFLATKLLGADVTVPENADLEQIKTYVEQIQSANGNMGVIFGKVAEIVGFVLAFIGRLNATAKVTI